MSHSRKNLDLLTEFERIQRNVDRSLATVAPLATQEIGSGIAPIDIYREDGAIHLEIALPKFNQNEITVEQEGRNLTVIAQRNETKKDSKDYILQESHEALYRSIRLPSDVDTKKIKTRFKDGILEILAPVSRGSRNGVNLLKIESA